MPLPASGSAPTPERNRSTWAGSSWSSVPKSRAERRPPSLATNQEPASRDLTSSKSKSETQNPSRPRVARETDGDVGRPQQRLIVDHDRHVIAGHVDIELPGIGAGFPAQASGFEGVLGRMRGVAPMSDDQGFVPE